RFRWAHAFGHSEFFRDCTLGIAIKFSHPHNTSAPLRQTVDQREDAPIFKPTARLTLGRRPYIILKSVNFGNGFDWHDPGATMTKYQKIARDGEEIGAGTINMIDTIQGRETRIRFLYQLVNILLGRMAREPDAHGPLVGNDMFRHPRGHAATPLKMHALRRDSSSPPQDNSYL